MAKILIIDDDGIVRDALSVFLMREGHEVLTAADGGNGVLIFRNIRPDLVILDRDLPVLSGSAVFQKIRELSASTPVMILTGYDAPEDAEAYLADGAACFLSKADGLSRVLEEAGRVLGTKAHPGPMRPAARKAPEPPPQRAGNKPLVLVADDDEAIVMTLSRFLASLGYRVIAAADGLAAEKLALERKPDVTLLDIYMPGKDGMEVLKTVLEADPGACVIMITGNEDMAVAKASLKLGAFDYLPKPINLDALQARIAARLLLQRRGEAA
jgi:DNA-binding response OmpR family regulator